MKHSIRSAAILFFLSLMPGSAWATFTNGQDVINGSCSSSSTTCAITVTSTTAGDAGVVEINYGHTAQVNVTGVTGGTWVVGTGCATSCSSFDSTASGGISGGYTLSLTGGSTTITVTVSVAPSFGWSAEFREASFNNGPLLVDKTGNKAITTNTVNPTGVALTLTGSNDFIVQGVVYTTTCTAISGSYTNLSGLVSAVLVNSTSGTAPTWTCPSGNGALNAIALKETGSGATANGFSKRAKLDKLEQLE